MNWQTAALMIVTWVFAAGLNYGLLRGRLSSVERRLSRVEDEKYLTRTEYEARHRELMDFVRAPRS